MQATLPCRRLTDGCFPVKYAVWISWDVFSLRGYSSHIPVYTRAKLSGVCRVVKSTLSLVAGYFETHRSKIDYFIFIARARELETEERLTCRHPQWVIPKLKISAKLIMNLEMSTWGNNRKGFFGGKQGQEEGTLQNALEDIDGLVKIWETLKSEAQIKLKIVIDHNIMLLRTSVPSDTEMSTGSCSLSLLRSLSHLGKELTAIGFEDNAVDDAVMEEIESMIAKECITTPAPTEV